MNRSLVLTWRTLALMVTVLLAGPTASSAADASKSGVTIVNPWIRATPGGATTAAAYLEIQAAPGVADRLVSVSSPAAARAELHTHFMDGDVMRMRHVDGLTLGPGGAALKPHGDHVMLIDLKAALKPGDTVPLTLVFEKAGTIAVEARVEPIGSEGPKSAARPSDPPPATAGHEHHH